MRFVDMYHPELDTTITVAEISAPHHAENGWQYADDTVDDEPDAQAEDLLVDGDNDEDPFQED